jgi:uncharacterized protein
MITVTDINVLLPILFADHAHQPAAWRWWEQQPDASVGLCLLTRLGTLRMLTNTRVMGGHPVAPAQAIAAWDSLAADPRCVWLEAGDVHEPTFRHFISHRPASPNLWTDAWLAALASCEGLRLTSFDSDFHSFRLPDFEHLKP